MKQVGFSFAAVLVLGWAVFGQAQPLGNNSFSGGDTFLPVAQAYQAEVIQQGETTQLQWTIAPGYYLYEHAFKVFHNGVAADTVETSGDGVERHDDYFGEVRVYYHRLTQQLTNPQPQTLTLQSQGCADAGLCYPPRSQYFSYNTETGLWRETTAAAVTEAATAPPLLLLLLMAFSGGLILNLMPCVLPVLTLKSLSFIKQHNRRQRIRQSWAYTAGVVCSFLAIAVALLLFKASGRAVGWGFQLQSPVVVAALVYLFFMMGLSLLNGLHLSAPVLSLSNPPQRSGTTSAFGSGVLACVVASPCTAPFMGTAIGAALLLPPAQNLLLFTCLGLGLAAPFLLLGYAPALGRWLPKPGRWMKRLQELLAFPLFATVIWLLSIVQSQTSTTGISLILGLCLLIALFAWWRSQLSLPAAGALLAACVVLTAWLLPQPPAQQQTTFSLQQLDELIQRENSVFVNVTADWCISCKVNERVALATPATQAALAASNTVYVVADWTNYNADIAALLKRHQRNGIPLYLHYRNGNIRQPRILPQLLREADILKTLQASSAK